MANNTSHDVCYEASPAVALLQFFPGMNTPTDSGLHVLLGFGIIMLCNFTTTYNHPLLPYIRLLLVIPAAKIFWEYGLSPQFDLHGRSRQVDLGMAMIAYYGYLKLFEICVVGFWNKSEDWPRWISRGDDEKMKGKGTHDKSKKPKVVPFTPTLAGRLLYAYDLLSVCGSSYVPNRVWNWAPKSMLKWQPPAKNEFLLQCIKTTAQLYFTLDLFHTLGATKEWDTTNPSPLISTSPFYQQIFYAFLVCGLTCLAIVTPYYFSAFVTVLLGAPPSAWPPLFDEPFTATSLQDFWSYRWHNIFRRSFHEISRGLLALIPTSYVRVHPRIIKFLRALIIFSLSASLHFFIIWALPHDPPKYPHLTRFFNPQTAKFFLSQPLGVLIEFLIVFPLTNRLPERWKILLRRVFAWGWLLWSGRFWADVWIGSGMWGIKERYVLYSPIRKLLHGRWTPC
ncbi:hypothetical protein FRC03_008799 [Tulasnella sp. 419]|nr:hypothetical protein FRC02_012354 [Tulasnella sp. 418]KAG8958818.1 hypothetical protein FRC03_008799 [Tulasnella sp. 419]